MALIVVALFSAAMILAGVVGLAWPPRLLAYAERWKTPRRMALAAGLRVAFGIALILAADASRAPGAFRAFGALMVLAGLVIPLLGIERIGRMITWWQQRGAAAIRVWCGLVVSIGVLVLYGAFP